MKFFKNMIDGIFDGLKAIAGGDTKCSLYQCIASAIFLVMLICLYFVFDYFFSEIVNIGRVGTIFLSLLSIIVFLVLLIGIFSLVEFIMKK